MANVIVLGATKGMGRAVARVMSDRGDRMFLLGRDPGELAKSARDLEASSGAPVGTALCDLEQPDTFVPALDAAARALGHVDTVVVTAGLFATQAGLEADRDRLRRMLTVNFTNTVLFCEAARTSVLRDGGTLCVFSSVAGERGRKPVAFYGAAKAGLTRYLEALDHKYRASGLRVVCVKPGFVRTSMTAGLPAPPFAGEPDDVARRVVGGIDRGTPVVYAPPIWALVMMVIRLLPRAVMRRVDF